MSVCVVYGFLLCLNLLSHGKSVPIVTNYDEYEENDNRGIPSDEFAIPAYNYENERYVRDTFPTPYEIPGGSWYPRSKIAGTATTPHKRHYHLFHLTPKHPNAVSYHVIEKTPVHRTLTDAAVRRHQQFKSSEMNNPHHQQLSTYQAPPGYNTPSYPGYGNNKPVDTTYQDILQEVANPMKFPSYPTNNQGVNGLQRDNVVDNIEEAAREFNKISADMNSMEMAALVMVPYHKLHKKTHRHKIVKSKAKKLKKIESPLTKISHEKEEDMSKKANLLNKLIKNDKKDDNDNQDEEGNDVGFDDAKTSEGSWEEEESTDTADHKRSGIPHVTDPSSKKNSNVAEGEGYTWSKRSEIPHVFDQMSISNEDDNISS